MQPEIGVKNPDTLPRPNPARPNFTVRNQKHSHAGALTHAPPTPAPPSIARPHLTPRSDRRLRLENPLLVDSQPGALRPAKVAFAAFQASHWARSTGTAMCHYPATSEVSPMSGCGYKQTSSRPKLRSALPPTPDIPRLTLDFRV